MSRLNGLNQRGRPSVTVFLPALAGGGAERMMLNLAAGVRRLGYPVDLLLVRREGAFMRLIPPGVRVVGLGVAHWSLALGAYARYVRRERPGAVLSIGESASLVALWAKRLGLARAPLYVGVHNTLSEYLPEFKRPTREMIRLCFPRLLRRADGVIAVSRGAAEDVARFAGMDAGRVQVIVNPVVTGRLFEEAGEPVGHRWFTPGEPPVVLNVGRLVRQKDQATLLRAFARARAAGPCRLVLLGEGPERAALAALAAELGVGADVDMPGFVPNPFAYMSRSAVFVLSSRFEGLPTVLIEAVACGVPVVSTDCPSGPREILAGGRHGRLVPVGDAAAMADAVGAALRGRLPPAHAEAWQAYTPERVAEQYIGAMLRPAWPQAGRPGGWLDEQGMDPCGLAT